MYQNAHPSEPLIKSRREEIDREVEHLHLLSQVKNDQADVAHRAIGSIGRSLISFGTWLEGIERHGRHSEQQALS